MFHLFKTQGIKVQHSEYATIKLKVLRAPDGDVTCRNLRESCKFYSNERWGTVERCIWTNTEIERKDNAEGIAGLGFTIPTEGCPCVQGKE